MGREQKKMKHVEMGRERKERKRRERVWNRTIKEESKGSGEKSRGLTGEAQQPFENWRFIETWHYVLETEITPFQ